MGPLNEFAAFRFFAAELAFLTVLGATLIYFPRGASASRLLSLITLAYLTYDLQGSTLQYFTNPSRRANVVPLLWIKFLSAAELVVISRVDAIHLSEGKQLSIATLAWRTMSLVCNWRRIDTRWEIKAVPKQPLQTRASFIFSSLAWTSLAYLIIDVLTSAPPVDQNLVTAEKGTLFHIQDLAAEDVIFRLIGTVSFWIMTCLLNFVTYTLTAILAVLTRLSTPDRWRPLHGSLSSVFTIRNFWGVFWHQCLRKVLTGPADAFADNILGIPRNTLFSRYTRIFLAFFISGLIHHTADKALGLSDSQAGSLTFFILQPLGIIFEDSVQAMTKNIGLPSFVRRVVGYIWVLVFLWWSTPQWFYPIARLDDQGQLLPYSIVSRLLAT